ncbi:nucleotidyltransferase domain-containing protein [Pedobacter sp. FW305-3-2-15-E-R2A2]|uniref:DNA polymerase beta superfamily protein n=1 Tax=Pedobacter sp. FW305-3-2-15-E-R2A2 TaxID=3140251 RepID=UPI00314049EE
MTIQDLKDKGLLLFECVSGSRSYGLATATSDRDLKGVYYLPKSEFYGLTYTPQISNESNDEVYYELGRYVELLIKNNPNMLEMLASPEEMILYKHPVMDKLNTAMFLSKLCRDTFAGYAITQIRKAKGLKKKIVNPLPKERATVLDFCFILAGYNALSLRDWLKTQGYKQEQCGLINIPHSRGLFALFYDEEENLGYKGIATNVLANELSLSSVPKGEKEMAYLQFNQDSYSSYCKEYREYWDWVAKRNEERYLNNLEHGKDYDAKNMMHTIRLLQVAEELLRTAELRIKRPNRAELLSIKSGHYSYDELQKMAEELIVQIDLAYKKSDLPEAPDAEALEKVLIAMRTELYH